VTNIWELQMNSRTTRRADEIEIQMATHENACGTRLCVTIISPLDQV